MLTVSILMSVILIGSGIAVKKNPNLIAGYNTMSEEEKKRVNVEGLSNMMHNALVGMGVLVLSISPILGVFGLQNFSVGAIIAIVMIGTTLMIINGQRFNQPVDPIKQKRSRAILITFFGLVFLATFGLLYYGSQTPQVKIYEGQIFISGIYSTQAKVENLSLTNDLPEIQRKTNGFDNGNILKGNFQLKGMRICKLYLENRNAPFIFVVTDDKPIFINRKDSEATNELFLRLSEELNQ